MWQIWLVYNGFTRGSIVSCHGMVRGDDEGYSNRRYKRNSYAVKAQTGRRYFYFFLLSFFLLILLAFCLRSRLFFFFFFFVWSSSRDLVPHVFFFTRNYAFLSVFLFWDSKRVSKEFRLLFALFQSLCAHPPFTARGAIVWSDNGIFYWIPVNTYPPLTASIVLRLIKNLFCYLSFCKSKHRRWILLFFFFIFYFFLYHGFIFVILS